MQIQVVTVQAINALKGTLKGHYGDIKGTLRGYWGKISFWFLTGLFSRVLRDTTPRFVRWLVGRSAGWLVGRSPFDFFYVFAVFGLTALAQVL